MDCDSDQLLLNFFTFQQRQTKEKSYIAFHNTAVPYVNATHLSLHGLLHILKHSSTAACLGSAHEY